MHLSEDKLKRHGYHIERDWSRIEPETFRSLRQLLQKKTVPLVTASGTVCLQSDFYLIVAIGLALERRFVLFRIIFAVRVAAFERRLALERRATAIAIAELRLIRDCEQTLFH